SAYHNSRGVLAIHETEHEQALGEFAIANSLNPEEARIATNLLAVEYTVSQENAAARRLPSDWDGRLRTLLEKNPRCLPALKLRVRRLAEADSIAVATEFGLQ